MSEAKPLRFASRAAARGWLEEHNLTGLVHETTNGYIIVQFFASGAWAFESPESLVHLEEW